MLRLVNPGLLIDTGALTLAGVVWGAVYFGYVLLAGMGVFWSLVWPAGHAVRRLRGVAVAGGVLIGLGTLAEALTTLRIDESPLGETVVEGRGTWLLVRLAVLAMAAFFGAELLRGPVRGARRIVVLVLIAVLTITLRVEPTGLASAPGSAVTTGTHLLSLAAWVGSMVALAALILPNSRPAGLEPVWTRFSRFSGITVAILAVSATGQHLVARETVASRSGVLLLVELLVLAGTLVASRYVVGYGRRLAFRERFLPGRAGGASGRQPGPRVAIGVQLITSVVLMGVVAAQIALLPATGLPGAPRVGNPGPTAPVAPTPALATATAGEARLAASDTPRFVPERIDLPGGTSAAVVPVATVGNELVVPEDGAKVGWWDGSSYVGDPFGSTVIAGHVDTVDGGLGFFFRLWNIKVGERVTLSRGGTRQAYAITAVREVPRSDLVDDDEVFDIGGPPRLALITCAGEFRPDRGGYSRNLIVVARPIR